MSALAKRIAALEAMVDVSGERFAGLLEFDARSQSRDDAARSATGPGIYLVCECGDTLAGQLCRVHADGSSQWMESVDGQSTR